MQTTTKIMQYISNSSASGLPPSFDGNNIIFGSALFCTMVATLLSLVQLYFLVKEKKAAPDSKGSPINRYRDQVMLVYLTVLMAVAPDAVYLWTFNEVTPATTARILSVDRLFDSLFLIPLGMFSYLYIRCGDVLKFQLLRQAIPVDIRPNTSAVRWNVICGILILFMSLGVTLSK